MVLVSHVRHLLRTVADELLVVHGGKAEPFDGDLDDYAKWLAESASAEEALNRRAAEEAAPPKASNAPETADDRKQRKREEAARRARLTPYRQAVEKCEKELERLAKLQADISYQLD